MFSFHWAIMAGILMCGSVMSKKASDCWGTAVAPVDPSLNRDTPQRNRDTPLCNLMATLEQRARRT